MQPRFFLLLISVLFSEYVFSQSISISASPASATLALNSDITSKIKLRNPKMSDGVVAFAPGYIPKGITTQEIIDSGKSDYTISLAKMQKPKPGYVSGKIEPTGLVDKSEKLLPQFMITRISGVLLVSVDLNDPKFIAGIRSGIGKAGYNLTNNLFAGKSEIPEYQLGAEVIWACKNATYLRQKVSLIVRWSVYSPSQDKVIFETTTAGYADSIRNGLYDETTLTALNHALDGLLYDQNFQNAVAKKAQTAVGLSESLAEVKSSQKKFENYDDMVTKLSGSVVTVRTESGQGTGFIISENGNILTNDHTINGAKKIEVLFNNGFIIEASPGTSNAALDVALIKISGNGFKPLFFNASETSEQTVSEIIAIGTKENIKTGQLVAKGIISGRKEAEGKLILQTGVAIKDNSGGPLINAITGELVGIVATKIKLNGVEGPGFAVPIHEAIKVLSKTQN